jgi:hypothetical protein
LFNKDKTILIKYPEGKNDKSFIIPNGVISIGDEAFKYCSVLSSVVIPTSVTSIGNYAFWDCSGLTEVIIPTSVTSIGEATFWGCSVLSSVVIPTSVTSIGEATFWGCSGLTEVIIPTSVTSIGNYAFNGCSRLTSVAIPNSVTSIGSSVFLGTDIYNNESNWDNGVLYIDSCLIKAKNDLVNGSYIIKEGTRIQILILVPFLFKQIEPLLKVSYILNLILSRLYQIWRYQYHLLMRVCIVIFC